MITMVDIGKLIHEKVCEQGRSVTWLARKLNYSLTNIYKIFEKPSIDTDVLMRISDALDYDFFAVYSRELAAHGQHK